MPTAVENTPDLAEFEADHEAGLTKSDRCDGTRVGCGAAALTRWGKPGKGDLIFCGHHSFMNSDELKRQGFSLVEDILDTIQHKPDSSAAAGGANGGEN